MAGVRLPDTLVVLERGWLSSNNVLGFDGESAALIDSGYVSHAPQTVALVDRALDGRRLDRLINTHSHSDHIGGNAALQASFGCRVIVPQGIAATIAEWDEDALLLTPFGQRGARFFHDATLQAGDRLVFGELEWRALAVPGHDNDALAFHCADARLLISGDALWQDGFGVIFSELLGDPDGLMATRRTLDQLSALSVDVVIPGHGSPFEDVDAALRRAYSRLAGFEDSAERLARHALKALMAFDMLDRRRLRRDDLPDRIAGLPFCMNVSRRYLGLEADELADWLARDLVRSGALREEDGWLTSVS